MSDIVMWNGNKRIQTQVTQGEEKCKKVLQGEDKDKCGDHKG